MTGNLSKNLKKEIKKQTMKTIDILEAAETLELTLRVLIGSEHEEALCQLAVELGSRLSYDLDHDENWTTDKEGDKECLVDYTLNLFLDNKEICTGEAKSVYAETCYCGERFSSWQMVDGLEKDNNWDLIASMLEAAKVIDDEGDLLEEAKELAPEEPQEPQESEDGEYAVMRATHPHEDDYTVYARYESKEDAERAVRNAQRAFRESNPSGAYGTSYAVGAITNDGTWEVI